MKIILGCGSTFSPACLLDWLWKDSTAMSWLFGWPANFIPVSSMSTVHPVFSAIAFQAESNLLSDTFGLGTFFFSRSPVVL